MNLYEYVASRIREFRTRHGGEGISQEALAKALDVSTNTISRWETGTYKPDLEDLDKLARFFGVSILEFFPPEKEEAREPIRALLRAAKELPKKDVVELQRYAEFRRARYLLEQKPGEGRARRGRPRKDAK